MIDYIREMAELGFRSVELEGIGGEHLQAVANRSTEIRNALDDHGLSLAVFCTVLPRLGSVHAEQRTQALELFRLGCETAVALGAPAVLDNGPLVPYEFPADLPVSRHYAPDLLQRIGLPASLDWSLYRDALVKTLQRACDIAAEHGLAYYLHPCCGSLTETTDGYLWLKQDVGRANLKFNFDVANQFYMRENLSLGLLKLAGEIDYIHISDNRGDRIEHRTVGDGAIDWKLFFATLARIGFRGQLSIDVGGAETGIEDLDAAYRISAERLEALSKRYELFKQ
ncbi:MAG: sugar phosphate isomerase/epimerase [Alistipes sp.]